MTEFQLHFYRLLLVAASLVVGCLIIFLLLWYLG